MGQATKGQAIGTGIISGLKVAIGIVVIVLLKTIIDAFIDAVKSGLEAPPPRIVITLFWIFGLPFIVPGTAGLFAAGFRNNVAYGIYMACCIISCVLNSIFCFLSFFWLLAMSASLDGVKSGCDIGNVAFGEASSPLIDCGKLINMSYAVAALMILGWILCLTGSIVSCSACCCGGQPSPQIVMMSSYPGQMTCMTTSHHQYPATSYALPPEQTCMTTSHHQNPATGYAPPPEQEAGDDVNAKNQYRYGRMN